MNLSPEDLSGLSGTSGGMLQRDQQQTAWERGGSVKQSFTEVLPGNFDAYGATVAQRKALERAGRERDPFKRARALEEAAAYGEEAARLKKPGAQRRPGVPVKRAVHLEQITTAEQAELQRREMQRRGVAIAQPKAVQLVAQVRQAVARILPPPAPKPTIQAQQYRMPTATRGGVVYGGGGATGSGYAIQMGEVDLRPVMAQVAKDAATPASADVVSSLDTAVTTDVSAMLRNSWLSRRRSVAPIVDQVIVELTTQGLQTSLPAFYTRDMLFWILNEAARRSVDSRGPEASNWRISAVAAIRSNVLGRFGLADPAEFQDLDDLAARLATLRLTESGWQMDRLATDRLSAQERTAYTIKKATAVIAAAANGSAVQAAHQTPHPTQAPETPPPSASGETTWLAPVAILGCSALGAWWIASSD